MSASATVLAGFASDEFSAQLYATLSSASQIVLRVKSRAQIIFLSAALWRLNARLDAVFQEVQDLVEGRKPIDPNAEQPTPERRETAISNMENLGHTLEYIYEQARRRNLTNNSMIAGSLLRVRKHSENLLDFADWIGALAQQEETESIFARAKEETNRGEIYSLSKVK